MPVPGRVVAMAMAPALAIALGLLLLVGCEAPQPAGDLNAAREALVNQQYEAAYRLGHDLSRSEHDVYRNTRARLEGSYIAGTAAWKLGRHEEALEYLNVAMRSPAATLRGRAQAHRGLVLADLGRHQEAADDLLEAAKLLQGQEQANAHFFAAISQQKLGQWSQARTNLILAKSNSQNPAFRQRCDDLLQTTGYTMQFGAFVDRGNAQALAEELAADRAVGDFGPPRIVSWRQDGRTMYGVHVGRFTAWKAAQSARDQLAGLNAIVVPLASVDGSAAGTTQP